MVEQISDILGALVTLCADTEIFSPAVLQAIAQFAQ
jgi:hypothetical protein